MPQVVVTEEGIDVSEVLLAHLDYLELREEKVGCGKSQFTLLQAVFEAELVAHVEGVDEHVDGYALIRMRILETAVAVAGVEAPERLVAETDHNLVQLFSLPTVHGEVEV